jgi:prephenate dehydrogenase
LRIAIIGGAGRMGEWFTRYFLKQGHEVIISDVRADKARVIANSLGVTLASNNVEAARMADLTFVSTPIDVTPKVLSEISPELREPMIVAEISSIKSRIMPVLKKIAEKGVRTLSIHPLFGPGLQEISGEKIALIPVHNQSAEEALTKSLFPGARIITVECEKHDRVMALTLALTHFINIVFASVVSEEEMQILKQLGGTTFTLQLAISEGVMTEDPMLYASIQIDNEHTLNYLENFMLKANLLKEIVRKKDFDGFVEFYRVSRDSLSRDEDFPIAYERVYRALKAL